ncbi:MAG: hypothetical protein PVF73_13010 [Bacteroidales bacterium]|jgi:hypothetical protein
MNCLPVTRLNEFIRAGTVRYGQSNGLPNSFIPIRCAIPDRSGFNLLPVVIGINALSF